MKGYDFERSFVDLVQEIATSKGIKGKPLADMAWPQQKYPAGKWRKIRNSNPPQELSMRDAYDLACALGVSFTDLCGAAQMRMLAAPPNEVPEAAPTKRTAKKAAREGDLLHDFAHADQAQAVSQQQ